MSQYTKLAWSQVEPARPYVHGWHIDAISEHLEAITQGQLTRLLINEPPGVMKSLQTCVFWPTYEWGPAGMPSMRFITYSFDHTLSTRDALKARRLIQSPWYQDLWGDRFKLLDDQNVKTRYENDRTGFRISDYVGGGTGDRGDRDIVDDPHQVKDPDSDAKRGSAILWLRETLPTRLNDPERSAIVVIHHRLHEQDMSAEILENDLGYEHLMLPMEYEPHRCCYTKVKREGHNPAKMRYIASQQVWLPDDWKPQESDSVLLAKEFEKARAQEVYKQDRRTVEGEVLFPERFPPSVVERDKKAMTAYAVAGQFQQRPTPRGGGKIKRHWFKIVKAYPADCYFIRWWDLAATKGAGAYTAGVLMGRSRSEGTFWVVDVKRDQLSSGEVRSLIKQTTDMDYRHYGGNKNYDIWLPQDPGQAGKAQVEDYILALAGFNVHAVPETGDKETRIEPFAAQAEAGNVHLLEGDWNEAYLAELEKFPQSKYKDQADATSGAFSQLILHPKQSIRIGAAKGAY